MTEVRTDLEMQAKSHFGYEEQIRRNTQVSQVMPQRNTT
jgi:hypothetical protein